MVVPVITVPIIYDEILIALLTFLVLFVAVRVVIRLWDLIGI
jgi:hypothetical protein